MSVDLERHPGFMQESTAADRATYRYDLFHAKTGATIHIHDDSYWPARVAASVRIPATSEAQTILDLAHHLFAIGYEINADVFFNERHAVPLLMQFGELDAENGVRLIGQPPCSPPTPSTDDFEDHSWEQLIGTFGVGRITDDLARKLSDWLIERSGAKTTVVIDSFGGVITPSFYRLVEIAQQTTSVTAIARRAHSAAALLFLAFPDRAAAADAEIVFKPQSITMSLQRAAGLCASDIDRYKVEYDRYSRLLQRLLKQNSRLKDGDINLILEKNAALGLDARNAFLAGVVQRITKLCDLSDQQQDAIQSDIPGSRQSDFEPKPFIVFPDPE
jgi:ATP-dependent protease ClpP protease subunit